MSTINYFIDSNSSVGKVDFYKSNFGDLSQTIKLYGYPNIVANDIFNDIIKRATTAEFDIEIIRNCLDDSISGIIIPKISVGVINIPIYDNSLYIVTSLMETNALDLYNENMNKATKYFNEALKIHDNWEKIYLDNIDFESLNSTSRYINEKIIGDNEIENTPKNTDRFFGASTINGSKDYVPEISNLAEKRYFIKGRPGSGKSTLLKKLIKNANDHGFNTVVYHCAFDPKSLDMVYIPNLSVCIFDSTAPHEYFPEKENDEILDVYKAAITDGTDEKYYNELTNIQIEYSSQIKIGTKFLNDAYKNINDMQRKYIDKIDYKKIKHISNSINSRIFG